MAANNTQGPFFGNKLSISEAFRKSRNQVIQFFREIRSNIDGHGIPSHSKSLAEDALKSIIDLSSQDLKSPFLPNPICLPTRILYLRPNDPPPSQFQMYTIFDIIGWIFSFANYPPTTAEEHNYYKPLAVIYARFCQQLSTQYQGYTDDPQPHMIALAYFTENFADGTNKRRVVLGASLGKPSSKDDVKTQMQKKRHLALVDVDLISRDEEHAPGCEWNYGHCAETWFFWLTKAWNIDKANAKGFAMEVPKLNLGQCQNYSLPDLLEALRNPCANCKDIIGRAGLELGNFLCKGATAQPSSSRR